MIHAVVSICNALVSIVILVGTGWAVFVAGHSPWWFLAAIAVDAAVSQSFKTTAVGDASKTEVGR